MFSRIVHVVPEIREKLLASKSWGKFTGARSEGEITKFSLRAFLRTIFGCFTYKREREKKQIDTKKCTAIPFNDSRLNTEFPIPEATDLQLLNSGIKLKRKENESKTTDSIEA